MKYDEKKWHYVLPHKDSFVYYIPVIRLKTKRLYGEPQKTRALAHEWILENLPVIEETTPDQPFNNNHTPDLESDLYVFHAGIDSAARPSDLRNGVVNEWRDKEDARWTITKRFDAKFFGWLRQFFT